MPDDEGSPPASAGLLQILRSATHRSHEEIDARFSAINLGTKTGYAHFLSAHLVGISPIYSVFKEFAERELHIAAPDLPAMLRSDLVDLGVDPATLPALDPPEHAAGAGICYVIAGSRLGIASIRTGAYWSRQSGIACRYMEDSEGLAVWRALAPWMRDRKVSDAEADHQCRSAIGGFDLFRQALSNTQTQAA